MVQYWSNIGIFVRMFCCFSKISHPNCICEFQRTARLLWNAWTVTRGERSSTWASCLVRRSQPIPGVRARHVLSSCGWPSTSGACGAWSYRTGLVTWTRSRSGRARHPRNIAWERIWSLFIFRLHDIWDWIGLHHPEMHAILHDQNPSSPLDFIPNRPRTITWRSGPVNKHQRPRCVTLIGVIVWHHMVVSSRSIRFSSHASLRLIRRLRPQLVENDWHGEGFPRKKPCRPHPSVGDCSDGRRGSCDPSGGSRPGHLRVFGVQPQPSMCNSDLCTQGRHKPLPTRSKSSDRNHGWELSSGWADRNNLQWVRSLCRGTHRDW